MNITRLLADATAKITVGTGPNDIQNLPTGSADTFLASGLNLIYSLAAMVAVIIIIIAGFMYTTSAGDSTRITKAKNAILYAVIGLVVVALAFVITQFVVGRF